jgi:hypothetical protein
MTEIVVSYSNIEIKRSKALTWPIVFISKLNEPCLFRNFKWSKKKVTSAYSTVVIRKIKPKQTLLVIYIKKIKEMLIQEFKDIKAKRILLLPEIWQIEAKQILHVSHIRKIESKKILLISYIKKLSNYILLHI